MVDAVAGASLRFRRRARRVLVAAHLDLQLGARRGSSLARIELPNG